MQKLFVETIETVCHYHYSPEQISVWTCSSDNLERWKDKLAKQYFIIAEAELTADVSITARPFFEKVGFRIVNRQTVVKQDIELMNYKMTRQLT